MDECSIIIKGDCSDRLISSGFLETICSLLNDGTYTCRISNNYTGRACCYSKVGGTFSCLPSESKYRIAGIIRGYKCSWFLLIKHVPQTFIPNVACMLACKRQNFVTIKSAKTFLTVFPKFILTKYPLYGS